MYTQSSATSRDEVKDRMAKEQGTSGGCEWRNWAIISIRVQDGAMGSDSVRCNTAACCPCSKLYWCAACGQRLE